MKYNALLILLLTTATTSVLKGSNTEETISSNDSITPVNIHNKKAREALSNANKSHRPLTAMIAIGTGAVIASGGDSKVFTGMQFGYIGSFIYSNYLWKSYMTEASLESSIYNQEETNASTLSINFNGWFPKFVETSKSIPTERELENLQTR